MNQETREPRELMFVCPICKGNSLRAEASGYLDIHHVYDDGVFEFKDMDSDDIKEIDAFQCRECGYQLDLSGEVGLSTWLQLFCSQDEPDAGQSEDQASEVPPSESDPEPARRGFSR